MEQVKEQVRAVRVGTLLESVARDLFHGARLLARSPGFTAAAVLALALGIGASTAVFSVVNAVLLRPLPYRDAGRLVVVLHRGMNPVAPANFLDWRRQSSLFEAMGAAEFWTTNLTGGDRPESVQALRVTADLLPLLGVRPLLGRLFVPEEEQSGPDRTVVLGHGLWQRRFAGDAGIVGRSITLDGETYVVVGVMPPGFEFPPFWATRTQLWAPLALGDRAASREGSSLRLFARLRPEATLEQARAEMAAITARLEREYPGTNRNVTVRPLLETVVGDVRPALRVLLAAVGFVLLMTCANVAHMLMARAAARHKEVALRVALGASRARMIRQLLTESLVLAVVGGGAGLGLAFWGIRVLLALSPPGLPRAETIALDGRVLAFALVASLATGIAFGLVPALQASRRDLTESLREGERGSTAGPGRLRNVLVASEFALALVLLVGAGLMIRSFLALRAFDPGFDPHNVLTTTVSVTGTRQADPARRAAFFRDVLQRVEAVPGVRSASAINHLPLAGDIWGWPFHVEGRPIPKPGETPTAAYRVVLPDYFRTLDIPIRRGRDVAESDRLETPGVVVVNEFLAARYWPGEDPIGKRITLDDPRRDPSWLSVVGVVKNTVRSRWAAAPEEEIFLSYLQNRNYLQRPSSHYSYLTLVLRTAGDPAALAPAVRTAVWSLDPDVPLSEIQTLEEVVGQSTAAPRFYLLLLAVFAALSLVLAAVGIYGVISYSVSRRTNEIGIRMALGANPADVLRLVVVQGLLVGLLGAGTGLVGALALTRLMSSLLYGVGASDPATFAAVFCLLGAVAFAASYAPARRATRIDPMRALRSE